ncbi:hypothetical protein JCM10450v2_005388 [Rhodotorula kratochvilovae]
MSASATAAVGSYRPISGKARNAMIRLSTRMYSALLGRSRPRAGDRDPAYELIGQWVFAMERCFSRAYYKQYGLVRAGRNDDRAIALFDFVGTLVASMETYARDSTDSDLERAHFLVRLVRLMPFALLGRSQVLPGLPDQPYLAVVQWCADVMRDFSKEYYLEHLNSRRSAKKAAAGRVCAYFHDRLVFWNAQRLQGFQLEEQRVQAFLETCDPEHIRQVLHLPEFLVAPTPDASATAHTPTHLDPALLALSSAEHTPEHFSPFPDAHLDPSWAFSLGVAPRLGWRAARAYGTTLRRWAARRAWN